MKKITAFTAIIFVSSILLFSCSKDILPTSTSRNKGLNSVNPDVPMCGTGYQWDYYLGKCVPICSSGYHNDSTTGACVENGGGGTTISIISNGNNPYDTIGAKHNSGCSFILNNINPNSSTLASDILYYTKITLANFNYDTTIFNSAYQYAITNDYYNIPDSFYEQNPDSLYNKLYNNSLIDLGTKNYLSQMNQIVDNIIGDNDPTQSIYNNFASSLISVENNITSDNTITDIEKKELLSTAAIYRYSYAYWGSYILNNSGGGISLTSLQHSSLSPNLLNIKLHWKGFGKADAAGGISGAVAGAIATLPVSLVGAGLGAVGGGLGASIAHLFFNI